MIILILLLSFILRIIKLNQSLWLDEAISVNVTQALSFKKLVFDFSPGDFHPPLFYLVLKSATNVFGSSEIASRVPSVLFGVGSVYLIYLIGKRLYDQKTALIAALLLATSPLHIYYSQEARMYMLAAFLATASVYFFVSLWQKDKIYLWIGFITSTALLLYTDYVPYLLIFLYLPALFILKKRNITSLKSFIPALILIIILLVPWLTVIPRQLHLGQAVATTSPAWASVVGEGSLKNLVLTFVKFTIGRISNDNNFIYALLFAPAAVFVLILFLLSLFRMSPKRSFLYVWFFGPIVISFVIAFYIPVFAYFRFIFVLPAFYLIWASAINTVNWSLPTRILLICALLINLISVSIYYTNPRFQREDWRSAAAYVAANSGENTIVLFESSSSFPPFDYYNKDKDKVKALGVLDSFNADSHQVEKNVPDLTKDKNKVFLFQYLSGITDPDGLVFEEMTKNNFKNTSTKNFEGVGFIYEFVK